MHYFYEKKSVHFRHCISPEMVNEEGLFRLTKLASLTDEVRMWLDENIGTNHWRLNDIGIVLMFLTKEDAMAFKLRWS